MEIIDQDFICDICNKTILDGQARYSKTNNHYDCEFPTGQPTVLSLFSVAKEMDEKFGTIMESKQKAYKKPIGQGVIATKVKKLVFEALKKYIDGEPTEIIMWIQAPEYRGPRWDLACWGINCKYGQIQVTVYSWSTMTNCAKSKKLEICQDGIMTFNVEPSDVNFGNS
ncbi:hypothetical protein GW796_08565 [archaeon]|nr:hypothetical protein [archaeon]